MDEKLSALVQRLEIAAAKLESMAHNSSAAPSKAAAGNDTSSRKEVIEFDKLVQGSFQEFKNLSAKVGGLVQDQSALLEKAFAAQRQLIATATVSKKPADATLMDLIKPLQESIAAIVEIKDKNRPSPLFSHLSAVAEGIPALGWVVVANTPAPHIGEFKDASQFYANRVIKENKEKNPVHVDWVKSFGAVLNDLQAYVKEHHTTGLAWNPKGGDASQASVSAPTSGPAPPPLPSAAQLEAAAGSSAPAKPAGGAAALLGELSKGTTGLRKVDKSEMTHKNPELRATSVVKAVEKPTASASAAKKPAARGPPKLELVGSKWSVENQTDNPNLSISETEIRQVVYVYNCHNCTLKIGGKVNAITIDNCSKIGVLVDSVVSSLDTVNSSRVQIQITGACPTAVVDKTDGYQLYLSKQSQDIELTSAKSSEMNVLVMKADGEYVEMPVCEQMKTKYVDGKLVSVPVEHKE